MTYFHCDPYKIGFDKNCKKELAKALKIVKQFINKYSID